MILSHLIFNSLKTKNPSPTGIKIIQFLNINNSMQKPYLWQDKDIEVCKPIYITNFVKIIQKKCQKFVKP